jgi:signal transduction histidine kinase
MGINYLSKSIQTTDENVPIVMEEMSHAIKRADTIIAGLLEFSTPSKMDTKPDDINTIITRSLGLVKHELDKHHITVERKLAGNLPPVLVDRNKVEEVFVNVFTNAVHAMATGGTLTVRSYAKTMDATKIQRDAGNRSGVRLRSGDSVVVIEVDDTGHGIPEDKIQRVFDPFFTTKPTGIGTGLGLTVVRKILELHSGTIELANRREGGVRATIVLKADRR